MCVVNACVCVCKAHLIDVLSEGEEAVGRLEERLVAVQEDQQRRQRSLVRQATTA